MTAQMSVAAPSEQEWYFSSAKVFRVVQADSTGRLTFWVTAGWYRRIESSDGVIRLIPMRRWRLWRHRVLWGFSGLVDGR